MNNSYFSSLLCITILAFAPACKKQQPKVTIQENSQTMIEIDSPIFESTEEPVIDQKLIKF